MEMDTVESEMEKMTGADLLIFSGQSNMEGETEALPADNTPIENAAEYRFLTDSTVPLCHPVGEFIAPDGQPLKEDEPSALLGSFRGNANMVPAFCRAYIRETGRFVIAVHAAKGPTRAKEWLPEGQSGRMLFAKAKAAIRKTSPARVLFIWLQGESDQLAGTSEEEYANTLRQLCDALKRELHIRIFAVIRVGRFTGTERDEPILAAQRSLCREDPDFTMLTEAADELWNQPRYMNPPVPGHFNCAGQEKIGEIAGSALGRWVQTAE